MRAGQTLSLKILSRKAGTRVEPGVFCLVQARPGIGKRHHRPGGHRRVPASRRRTRVRSGTARPGSRSFRPQQGHPFGRAGGAPAPFRPRSGYHQVFRSGAHGNRTRPAAGRRAGEIGRPGCGRRFPYLHLRSARSLCHRCRIDRPGGRLSHRAGLAPHPGGHQDSRHRPFRRLRVRKGPDPQGHFRNRG